MQYILSEEEYKKLSQKILEDTIKIIKTTETASIKDGFGKVVITFDTKTYVDLEIDIQKLLEEANYTVKMKEVKNAKIVDGKLILGLR